VKTHRAVTGTPAVPTASWSSEGRSDIVSRPPMALSPQAIVPPAAGSEWRPVACRASCGSGAARCRALVTAAGPAPDALPRLVEQAWPEVRALVRRAGARGQDADDLTQAYFALFIEKDYLRRLQTWDGCIRPFLLTTLRHFLSNARDHARAMKRGGRARTLSLEDAGVRVRHCAGLVCASTPESLLASAERQRALRHAIATVAGEVRGEEASHRLATLLSRLAGESIDDRDIARRWGVSPVAVRVAAHRLRLRLARAFRQERPPSTALASRSASPCPPRRRESLSAAWALPTFDRRVPRDADGDRGSTP
jgi:DNA-directed RNA polymerase specialized sigma24 family protein